jgi:hypothetical protein
MRAPKLTPNELFVILKNDASKVRMSLITDQHHYFPSDKRFHTIPCYPAKQLLNKTIDPELSVHFNHFNTATEDITFELHA